MRALLLAASLSAPTCMVEYTVGAPAEVSDESCPEGQVACGDGCAAPGACTCAEACDRELEVCEAGSCVCRPGLVRCGAACVDVRADAAHCGACDSPCDADSLCEAGACLGACTAPNVACGGACVDLRNDALHCDECGHRCRADELCSDADCRDYVAPTECDTCPCDDACGDQSCCHSPFIGGPACIEGECS